jgi:hypothetical protein
LVLCLSLHVKIIHKAAADDKQPTDSNFPSVQDSASQLIFSAKTLLDAVLAS